MPLPQASPEQAAIVAHVLGGKNVVVNAAPGAGKSTTAMHVARALAGDNAMLFISYNRSLCDATRASIEGDPVLREQRVGVFTYHGLLSSMTGRPVPDDLHMLDLMDEGMPACTDWPLRDFTLLMVDEAQDIRPDYFRLLQHLVHRVCAHPERLRMVVVGDTDQLLYDFYGESRADGRFLTKFGDLISVPREWVQCRLSTSYRLTAPMTTCVNALAASEIRPSPVPRTSPAPPVDLYVCNVYRDAADIVASLVAECAYPPGDVMVLTRSLNARSPARAVVDRLVQRGYPVFVNRSGTLRDGAGQSNGNTSQHKITFRTFCSSKGLEARLVVVLGTGPLLGPEPLEKSQFVGLTRARERLAVLQERKHVGRGELEALQQKTGRANLRLHVVGTVPAVRASPVRTAHDAEVKDAFSAVRDVSTLFAFVDVRQVQSLRQSYVYDRCFQVPPEIAQTSPEDPADGGGSAYDPGAVFAEAHTHSFDGGHTYTNLGQITGCAVSMALQCVCAPQGNPLLPPSAKRVLRAVSNPHTGSGPKAETIQDMCVRAVEAMRSPGTTTCDILLACMALALAVDAWEGFGEKLTPSVQFGPQLLPARVLDRLTAVREFLALLVGTRDVTWNAKLTRQYDAHTVCGTPCMLLPSSACVVHTVYAPEITHLHRMEALAMAGLVVSDCAHVVNIHAGVVERVKLVAGVEPEAFVRKALQSGTGHREECTDSDFIQRHGVGKKVLNVF